MILKHLIGKGHQLLRRAVDLPQQPTFYHACTGNHINMRQQRDIMEDLDTASGSVTESISEMRKLLAMLDDTLAYNDTALARLQGFCSETKAACEAVLAGLDALENAGSLIKGGPAVPDTTQLRAHTAELLAALTRLNGVIDSAIKEYQNTGSVSEATQAQLNDALQTVFSSYTAVISDLNDLINNTDLDGLRDQNEETLRQILASLQTAMDSFYGAVGHLSAAMGYMDDALGTLRTLNSQAKDIFAQLDTTLSAVQRWAEAMSRAVSKAAQWVRDLSGEDVGSFSPLGPEFSESSDALNTSLGGISNELSALNSEIASSNTVLLSDVRAVNNQFMKVMNLFLNVLNNTKNIDYTDVFEDVSEESLQSAVRGKVLECTNYGSVAADRNAGGIAGAMAIAVQIVLAPIGVKPHKIAVLFRIKTNAVVVAVIIKGTVGSGITVRGHSLSAGQNIAVTQSVYHIVKFSLKFIGFQVFSEIVPSRPKLVPGRTEVGTQISDKTGLHRELLTLAEGVFTLCFGQYSVIHFHHLACSFGCLCFGIEKPYTPAISSPSLLVTRVMSALVAFPL